MRIPVGLLPLLALFLLSCEEPFTPKAPFESRPVVTCIVSGNILGYSVSASVAKTYDVGSLNPLDNRLDPFDTSAVVSLLLSGDKFLLKLTKSKRSDTTRYTTPQYLFSSGGLLPYFSAGGISMTVATGSGGKLSATTVVPRERPIETSYDFVGGVTAWTVQPLWTFDWDSGQRDDHLYFPKMLLSYQIINGASALNKQLEIPLRYIIRDGKTVPVYPSFTRNLKLDYAFSALETAIASISEGDSVKSRYKIGMLAFTLVEYDVNLSNYYSSSHGYLDEYSIRVDETTYSNINGGIGIFGSYYTSKLLYEMKPQFIRSFGYQM
jgi:hypothetical protein